MTSEAAREEKALVVESHGIEAISEEERHGKPRNQFTIRFAPAVYLAPLVIGGIGISEGLGLTGTITAIVLANLLGSALTGACAVMGPRLGMPQMAMGRVVFGYVGNYLPAFLSTLLYIGYFSVGVVLSTEALVDLFGLPRIPVMIGVAVVSVLIALFGHDLLHLFGKWVTGVSIVVLLVASVFVLMHGTGGGAAAQLNGKDYWLKWLIIFTIAFSITASWATSASDYSRYLPREASRTKIFISASLGLFSAFTWLMVLGALLTTVSVDEGVFAALGVVLPAALLKIVLFVLGVATIPHNAVNLYAGAMTSLAWGLPLRRSATVILAGVIGSLLAVLFGGPRFQDSFNAFLFLIGYYVTPWLAIVCVDFFLLRRKERGYPPVAAFFHNEGPLRGIKWQGVLAFVIAIAVSSPLMATNLYIGPIGRALGGADLSYFVSFALAGIIYFFAARRPEVWDEMTGQPEYAKVKTRRPVGTTG
jgi:NCS1 family nucleobase:cation symporter-1